MSIRFYHKNVVLFWIFGNSVQCTYSGRGKYEPGDNCRPPVLGKKLSTCEMWISFDNFFMSEFCWQHLPTKKVENVLASILKKYGACWGRLSQTKENHKVQKLETVIKCINLKIYKATNITHHIVELTILKYCWTNFWTRVNIAGTSDAP